MKRIILASAILMGLIVCLSSCKDDYDNRTSWSSESMTMSNGELVSIKYQMNYEEYYDSHLKETVCSLNKAHGTDWITTYYVRRGDKLYESKYSPYKYLVKKDEYTGKVKRTKNEFWQKKMLSIDEKPAYTVVQDGEKLELIFDEETKYFFTKDKSYISL